MSDCENVKSNNEGNLKVHFAELLRVRTQRKERNNLYWQPQASVPGHNRYINVNANATYAIRFFWNLIDWKDLNQKTMMHFV